MKPFIIFIALFFYAITGFGVECTPKHKNTILKSVVKQDTFWPNGKTLNIYFAEGSTDQKNFVISNASLWTSYANLTFAFHPDSKPQTDADVIIAFSENGNFSNIGIEGESVAHALKVTMNLEVVRSLSTERDRDVAKRTVLHEFGHVLGFMHEHQSPYRSIKINRAMATKLCSSVGWSAEECENNIFHQYGLDETMATEFDFKSVMLYPMTRSVYGWIINDNWELSQTDKIMAALIYPGKMGVKSNKTIIQIDRITKSHRPFGKFSKVKDVSDLNNQNINKSFEHLKELSLGYVPPESIRSVALKIKLAKSRQNKDISINVTANGNFLKTVIIPKDYPEKKEIEFIIPEFNLQHLYSGNESELYLTTDSDFLFLGAELEIEILSFIQ